MLARTAGVLLACSALASAVRADDVMPPAGRRAPRIGVLVGMEGQVHSYSRRDDYAIAMRVEGETRPLAGGSHHALTQLGILSGTLFREGSTDERFWRKELRLVQGIRWTAPLDRSYPWLLMFVDAGLGASWTDQAPGASTTGQRGGPLLRGIGRAAVGMTWRRADRTRWIFDLAWWPYFGEGYGQEVVGSIGCSLALR